MRNLLLTIFTVSLVFFACGKSKKENSEDLNKPITQPISKPVDSTNVELSVYDFEGFERLLEQDEGKTHVINFWATWCAPCVKELPYFEKLNANFKDDGVEVVLVSLDFPHLYDKKLKPFIIKNKLQSKVVALDDPNMNDWIPKVSDTWSGSIPATIIYNKNLRKFYEQSFSYEELETELQQFLN